jgi:hypothetical protein
LGKDSTGISFPVNVFPDRLFLTIFEKFSVSHMINAAESIIQSVSVHHIGNASLEQKLKLSDAPLEIEHEKIYDLLLTYFLTNFTIPEYYNFTSSDDDFTLNPLYKFVSDILEDPASLHKNSIDIARHLYDATQHPNIKPGDLYVAYFNALAINGQHAEAVGIFKSETKDSYLKLKSYSNQFDLIADEGINIKKLDKGCLILNLEKDAGFKILIVDNSNRADAQFWKQGFLNIKPWSDAYHHTQQYMSMTREFVANQVPEEFGVSKADQIDLMNRSVNFFKSKEQFNQSEFEVEVLGDAEVIESFRKYGKSFMANTEAGFEDDFEISAHAVKQQARVFKSVLKLDKNFHIYIHGNRELIEKGFDEKTRRNYYKIYFDHES